MTRKKKNEKEAVEVRKTTTKTEIESADQSR